MYKVEMSNASHEGKLKVKTKVGTKTYTLNLANIDATSAQAIYAYISNICSHVYNDARSDVAQLVAKVADNPVYGGMYVRDEVSAVITNPDTDADFGETVSLQIPAGTMFMMEPHGKIHKLDHDTCVKGTIGFDNTLRNGDVVYFLNPMHHFDGHLYEAYKVEE